MVKTVGDFLGLVSDPGFALNNKIKMVEVVLPPMDAPPALMDKWLVDDNDEEVGSEDTNGWQSSKRIKLDSQPSVDSLASMDSLDI